MTNLLIRNLGDDFAAMMAFEYPACWIDHLVLATSQAQHPRTRSFARLRQILHGARGTPKISCTMSTVGKTWSLLRHRAAGWIAIRRSGLLHFTGSDTTLVSVVICLLQNRL